MPVGNQSTLASLNTTLTSLVLQARNLADQITNFNGYVTAQGGATFLTSAAIGMAAGDANTFMAILGNHGDWSGIYQGQAAQNALPFNYKTNGQPAWGGQP